MDEQIVLSEITDVKELKSLGWDQEARRRALLAEIQLVDQNIAAVAQRIDQLTQPATAPVVEEE